jgi:hypothetical protein
MQPMLAMPPGEKRALLLYQKYCIMRPARRQPKCEILQDGWRGNARIP